MTTFTDEIREVVSPHKFGGSRRAAACYIASLDSSYDEASGDVDSPTGWFARHGRTIQYADSQGFIDCEKFATEDDARKWFAVLDARYCDWDDDDVVDAGKCAVHGPTCDLGGGECYSRSDFA